MHEGIVIDTMPVLTDQCGDEQEERAVRLVEVRHHPSDDPVGVAGCDDDACREDERLLTMCLEVAKECSERRICGQFFPSLVTVGLPLLHMKFPHRGLGMTMEVDS